MKPRKEPPGSTVLGLAAGPSCAGCGQPASPGTTTTASCPACGLTMAAGPVTQPASATAPRPHHSETSGHDDPFAEVLAHPALRERFEILGKVGQGGMGAIFEARDTRLKRRVALKLVLHATRDHIARFEKEGELLAALSHPRILTVYGAEVIGNVPVLVMELLEGRTLKADLLHLGWYEPCLSGSFPIRLARSVFPADRVARTLSRLSREPHPITAPALISSPVEVS